ncbi:hemolysin family protein [Treponema sp. Marseille-Q4523]|uniref:hemolysin family protein n=1 Tax=Treponema sp. Marseille-Q4523 TaxID=2810610 RepID=UPI0019619B35|nr:hemolysin family protein [Treponema sp. Marseille-Q4523]MBM7022061.1 HlyC/CorC family transporter [Treponema sp. Marseille-Q4523]
MENEPPDNPATVVLLIAAAAVLITLSALFSISESSFLGMNKLRLRIKRKSGDRSALRAAKLLEKKDVLINSLLVANDLVNILLSAILTAAAIALFGKNGVGIATFTTTVLLLIFGEITPKAVSTRHPDVFAYALSKFVSVTVFIFKPISIAFTAAAHVILHLFGVSTKKPDRSYTEEEIKTFIAVGAESGALEKDENAIMNRVFKFTDLEAQDIMIPRTKIVAVSDKASWRDIIEKAERSRFSRFPVYRKDIDDIVGVLYIKDLLAYKEKADAFSVRTVMHEPIFILGTKKMSSVQEMLRENRQSLAIVVDEYSGTDGIITQSDIAREIFGITDSNASGRGHLPQVKIEDTSDFVTGGDMLLSEARELLHVPFASDINETLGGWITERLGDMPRAGDCIEYEGLRFTVLSIKDRRINKIHVKRIAGDDGEE